MKKVIVGGLDQINLVESTTHLYLSGDTYKNGILPGCGFGPDLIGTDITVTPDENLSSLSFNGTTSKLESTDTTFNPNLFSFLVSFKVGTGGFANKQTLFSTNLNNSTDGKISIEITNADQIGVYIPNNTYPARITGLSLSENLWYNLAIINDGVDVVPFKFYLNYSEVAPIYTVNTLNIGDCFTIGYKPTVGEYFNGELRNFRIIPFAVDLPYIRTTFKIFDSNTLFQAVTN